MKNVVLRFALTAAVSSGSFFASPLHAQSTLNAVAPMESSSLPEAPSATMAVGGNPQTATQSPSQDGPQQTKRILGIIPNFRSVSADVKLPPQTPAQKFKTGLQDSFDYSAIIFVAAQAGVADAEGSTHEFSNTGASGGVVYGRYFWHTFADNTGENMMVESIVPTLTHEDSRYYTLGHGSYIKRAGYALTRGFITRTDSGSATFNVSEIAGAGAASGISSLYYPGSERTFTKVYQRWITDVAIDSFTFAVKEFWPDVNHSLFHQKTGD
jgi:hypothetical protein